MKKTRLLCMFLCLTMLVSALLMTGCSSKDAANANTTNDTSADASTNVSTDTADTTASTDSAETEIAEIYTVTDRNSLSGLVSPLVADRSGINKALPEPGTTKSDLTVAFSIGQMGAEFFTIMVETAQKKCEEYGYEFLWTSADSSIDKQIADVESFIAMGVDAIILNPMDTGTMATVVQDAVDAGIVVICSGTDFDPSVPVVTSILANNYYGGWYSGLYMGKYFADWDCVNTACILGMLGHNIDESRTEGMMAGWIYARQEAKGEPFAAKEDAMLLAHKYFAELRTNGTMDMSEYGMKVLAQGEGLWSFDGGLTAAEDIIAAHGGELDLIYADADAMGLGAKKAMEDAGFKPGEDIYLASSADAMTDVLDAMQKGEYLVTGYNSPELNGGAPVDLLHMIFEEGFDANNMLAATDLPYGAVSIENYEEYYNPGHTYAVEKEMKWVTIDEFRANFDK